MDCGVVFDFQVCELCVVCIEVGDMQVGFDVVQCDGYQCWCIGFGEVFDDFEGV